MERINALFQFIEFLHSNIENFNNYNSVIADLENLYQESSQLKPHENYKDKIMNDKIYKEIEVKRNLLDINILNPIKEKAFALNIWESNGDRFGRIEYNLNTTAISQLQKNITTNDLENIFLHKKLYLEYRNATHQHYFEVLFFSDLDMILKKLFNFFRDTNENEFESFEQKKIRVTNWSDGIKQLKLGNSIELINETEQQKIENLEEKFKNHFYEKAKEYAIDYIKYGFSMPTFEEFYEWYLRFYCVVEKMTKEEALNQKLLMAQFSQFFSGNIKISENNIKDWAKSKSEKPATSNLPTDQTKDKGFNSPEFDVLFGNDLKSKNEVWQYMIDLKMIDENGLKKATLKPYFIVSFILAMQDLGKIPLSTKKYLQIKAFTTRIYGGDGKRINENSAIIKDEFKRIMELLSKK